MLDGTASILCLAIATQLCQAAPTARYQDAIFANIATTPDIKYGSNTSSTGASENLLLDIYQPVGDTAKARALLIFIHGGGFSGGTKTDGDIVFLCNTFAKKGYVTASIGYRLDPAPNTKAAMAKEVLRAVQDAKAAVRFLRAHRGDYKIDDAKIMMGGTSAGGALSLNYAYLDANELPASIDTATVGGIEGRSGSPGVSSAINGIINCWGGISDSAILYNAKLPVLSFHGTADDIVPYDIGIALHNPELVTYGSACVNRVLARVGTRSELKPFVGMGHGFPAGNDPRVDTLVTLSTQFAYDVLFGKNSSAISRHASGGRRAPSIRENTVRLVNGRREGRLEKSASIQIQFLHPDNFQ